MPTITLGELRAGFRSGRHRERMRPHNDLWIAATAARHSGTVLTYDDHFKSIVTVGSLILATPDASR